MNKYKILENRNVLVTGGAGFIGSHLCEKLLEIGANVYCIDNLSTGNIKNIDNILYHKKFKFYEGDITDLDYLKNNFKNIEYISHQAALGSVPRSILNPLSSHNSNVNGHLNILELAKLNKVKLIVFASSSSVYGDSIDLPKIEKNIGNPLSPYALTKKINEQYSQIFNLSYGLNYVGLRYFNVFGPKQDPNGPYAAVIPKFINNLINGKQIIINGDGFHERDFTYIENVVDANLLSLISKKSVQNQCYNVGCGQKFNLNYLAKSIVEILNKFDYKVSDDLITHGPERDGDIKSSLASIEKISKNLGYYPYINFYEGLNKLISYQVEL